MTSYLHVLRRRHYPLLGSGSGERRCTFYGDWRRGGLRLCLDLSCLLSLTLVFGQVVRFSIKPAGAAYVGNSSLTVSSAARRTQRVSVCGRNRNTCKELLFHCTGHQFDVRGLIAHPDVSKLCKFIHICTQKRSQIEQAGSSRSAYIRLPCAELC